MFEINATLYFPIVLKLYMYFKWIQVDKSSQYSWLIAKRPAIFSCFAVNKITINIRTNRRKGVYPQKYAPDMPYSFAVVEYEPIFPYSYWHELLLKGINHMSPSYHH